MKKISIIMPFLNEGNWPLRTVQSIYDTADPSLFEIIAINDNPNDTYDFSGFADVRYIKNEKRLGVDGSRQLGSEIASTDRLFIVDAHTLFYPNTNWLNKIIDCIDREPTTAWCFTCVGLWTGKEDIYQPQGEYYGADLKLYTEKEKDRPCRQIIEPVWCNKKPDIEGEIQVILGANYAFSKKQFELIHGLKGLRSWGSSEPCLSIKNWLSGASCKINTTVKTAHLFRGQSPFSSNISDLIFNKALLLKTIFPKDLEDKLMTHIPKDINFTAAMKLIGENKDEIEKERAYYQSIFKISIYDLCKKFNIELP